MGVHPKYRGRGIGRALLEACIAKAWIKGITRIELEARADNAGAIRLYERVGFRHEAVKRNAMRFDRQYFDAVQMSLLKEQATPLSGEGPSLFRAVQAEPDRPGASAQRSQS